MTVQNLKLSSSVAMLSDIAEYQSGVGIPVVDQNIINKMIAEGVTPPSDYIFVPNFDQDSILQQQNDDPSVGQTDRSYLDILFRSIRALQAEVAKLRNTMRYGMYSYTDERTAQSNVLGEYAEQPENEPLWAIEEADLAEIDDAYVDFENPITLQPTENLSCGDRVIEINPAGVTWTDFLADGNGYWAAGDAKEFLYLTTSNTTISVTLSCYAQTKEYEIRLNELGVIPSLSQKYNIMICVSRATKLAGDKQYYGKNFVWIGVADYGYTNIIKQGYWNPEAGLIQDDMYEFGTEATAKENRMFIYRAFFSGLDLYKFNAYSKYQDFSEAVLPTTPTDVNYKYDVAHITIRSVKNETVLQSISKQLKKNELIYNEGNNGIYIVVDNAGKYKLLNNNKEDTGMTQDEIISWLKQNGIHVTKNGGEQVRIDDLHIGSVTFINEDTKKTFRFKCTPQGELKGYDVNGTTLSSRLSGFYDQTEDQNAFFKTQLRGFAGNLRLNETNPGGGGSVNQALDCRLNSDRIKIGAIYAPSESRAYSYYGCTHAFVELENTSDTDFQLDGCYLFYANQAAGSESDTYVRKLALTGTIPAGGTYLIRGKQYTTEGAPNCTIAVNSFDQEWYVENTYDQGSTTKTKIELIDFELNDRNTWMLAYCGSSSEADKITYQTIVSTARESGTGYDANSPKYKKFFIDSVSIGAHIQYGSYLTWTSYASVAFSRKEFDCIYKNTFELDPAIQAYQALCTYDSKRIRNAKEQDYQYLQLGQDVIQFPKSDDMYDIKKYTPKASYENKNVSTDKTSIDIEKPNMVGCAFGIDMRKTRCFSWVSPGIYDEFVWIRKKGTDDWNRFESYTGQLPTKDHAIEMVKKQFITTDAGGAITDNTVVNAVYKRIISTFPGCAIRYTAHKCVIDIVSSYVNQPTEYEYCVGRAKVIDNNLMPDPAHTSDMQTFTLYPADYMPKVYQITDQQGFHWIEYQVWAAAAHAINKKIADDLTSGQKIIPVLINTGDMTQNGTRINEWLDYYNGGKCLFNHLEQMNVIGNNDLCGSEDETKLGTGDDEGKSNGFYFSVFYCYEIEYGPTSTIPYPIINGKYVPSLYYFMATGNKQGSTNLPDVLFIMINSELTIETCKTWYKLTHNEHVVNAYTGWQIKNDSSEAESGLSFYSSNTFTPIYEILYKILSKYPTANVITVCHEMPFTVITTSNLAKTISDSETLTKSRSIDKSSGALVGSHLNTMGQLDVKSNQWFGRLLENFNVKLCIGGHKHTYACTRQIRELYKYSVDAVTKNSALDGKMTMPACLSDDTADFKGIDIFNVNGEYVVSAESGQTKAFTVDGSRFPIIPPITNITEHANVSAGINVKDGSIIYPYYAISCDTGNLGTTYFMLQATGYKLTSNKELPSPNQAFSFVIPKTTGDKGTTPSPEQKYPMFAEISLQADQFSVKLIRLHNILDDSTHTFDQQHYSPWNQEMAMRYMQPGNDLYGSWVWSSAATVITRSFNN